MAKRGPKPKPHLPWLSIEVCDNRGGLQPLLVGKLSDIELATAERRAAQFHLMLVRSIRDRKAADQWRSRHPS
jgi:hypothetical protein